jgi:aerotaxis receptor
MRHNGPVTQREYLMAPDVTLVSVTDPKGRITYCNRAFAQVSGYSSAELLGQAHNMVRHPDMPSEAFRDMWATIESGRPWSGMVKNRRKDGDHYWVVANATPVRNGDRVVGFMSVRTAPSREQVQAAESLYAGMNQEAERGRLRTVLRAGQVVRADPLSRAQAQVAGVARSVGLLGAVSALAMGGVAVAAVAGAPLWACGGGAVLIGWGIQGLSRWQINASLGQVTEQALRLAAGDLCASAGTVRGAQWQDLQGALNQLGVNIRTVVLDCRTEIENLRVGVAEIANGNQDLSARTESQASSLQQAAASMEEITGTVRQSAASAADGARLAEHTASVAQRTHACVEDVSVAMQQIQTSSARIGDIIHVIEGVAFQTNLLALNAAVEAARAGESGRGFAVVAAEVRNLAHRTSDAAKQVRTLIGEAGERVESGSAQTRAAQARMGEALGSVAQVASVLASISHSSQEQQSGISQVNEAVTHLDGITQQNAALVEQLAAAASSVSGQVLAVESSMQLFRLRPGDLTVAEVDAVALRRVHKPDAAPNDPRHSGRVA